MLQTVFTTDRLMLRPPVLDDAGAIFHTYAQDAEVTRYLIWQPHPDIATTHAFLERCIDGWAQGTPRSWVITARDDGGVLGMVSLQLRDFQAILGYVLARAWWGQGFAPEAARAVVDAALAERAIYRVWAVCDEKNDASARVLEKIGMQRGTDAAWGVAPKREQRTPQLLALREGQVKPRLSGRDTQYAVGHRH